MKNRRWLRMTGWILALVMILSVLPIASFAENDGELESDNVLKAPPLMKRPVEVDITNAVITYTNAGGNATEPAQMDPNQSNQMKLTVSGLNEHNEINKDTVMAVALPENISVTSELSGFLSDTVNAALGEGKLLFSWKGEKQDSFEASVTVLPHMPTQNDLSGSYILGTYGKQETYRVMLRSDSFMDGKRGRLRGSAFQEIDGKVYLLSEGNTSIWNLKHITENYYVMRSADSGKYLKIDPTNNGLLLEEATELTAQKLQLEKIKDGYIFKYKDKIINNSSFNAEKGFASWNASDRGDNTILKLYQPSDIIQDTIVDLSGTWVITNAKQKNALTSEKHSVNGRLIAKNYTAEGEFLIKEEGITTFTFKNIIRDWYTVQTENGYLNINDKGAFISDNPQHLIVKTKDNYNTIILSNSELNDAGYTLTNLNGKTSDGYGTLKNHSFNNNTNIKLISVTKLLDGKPEAMLMFNLNGGTGDVNPDGFAGNPGQQIVLPSLNATKDGEQFIGWTDVSNIYQMVPGTNHRFHVVYKPGTTYTVKTGENTLYAMYNPKVKNVQFGIRKDGLIQDEPNNYDVKGYGGHFTIENDLKEGRWVIDIDSTKTVQDYYVVNNVTANVNRVPTAEEMVEALKNDGGIDFDPETQYIHWYVLKCNAVDSWHVDGVIRNKKNVEITYNTNVPAGTDKTQVKEMPGGYQVAPGTQILIGTGKDSQEVKTPQLNNYVFSGWNTQADGTGTNYAAGGYVRLKNNLNLYAQWAKADEEDMVIVITSNWPEGKPAYAGTEITLTANLTGFEKKTYTLQWQYSTDLETWIDEPYANGINFTYEMNETTENYTWRVIANNIQDKQ